MAVVLLREVPQKSTTGVMAEVALTLAAVGGFICIVLVALALAFGLTLIMFKTGSMTPTIPAGSVALVRDIPASQVRVGDIVTLSRPGLLPVTHRVTSVTPVNDQTYSITMRGDANAADDATAYVVDRARIVLASTPGLASMIMSLSNPLVMGTLSVAAGGLVTWAFWPRKQSRQRHQSVTAPLLQLSNRGEKWAENL